MDASNQVSLSFHSVCKTSRHKRNKPSLGKILEVMQLFSLHFIY